MLHLLQLVFNFHPLRLEHLNGEALDEVRNFSAILIDELDIVLAHVWHVEDIGDQTKD